MLKNARQGSQNLPISKVRGNKLYIFDSIRLLSNYYANLLHFYKIKCQLNFCNLQWKILNIPFFFVLSAISWSQYACENVISYATTIKLNYLVITTYQCCYYDIMMTLLRYRYVVITGDVIILFYRKTLFGFHKKIIWQT